MRVGAALVPLAVATAPAFAITGAVPWPEAEHHVGRLVVIEGFVETAERDGRYLTLAFDPDDPRALRVTLVIPIMTDLPPEPERLYAQRRIHVHGRITRTAGHLALVVTDPDRITVVGVTPPAAPEDGDAPAAATPPSPDDAAAPSGNADAVAACARLRDAREAARREGLAAADALRACLASHRAGCREAADALAEPPARLDWLEQTVRTRCPED